MWRCHESRVTRGNVSLFRWIACGILLAVGVVLYAYTLSFPFVFDDHIYLVNNPLVKDAGSFSFMRDFSTFVAAPKNMGLDPDLSTNFILRPVAYLTFHLNYAVDGLRPRGYRAVNIALHCLNAILLFQVLWRLLGTSQKRGDLSHVSVGFIAFGSALLFLVHPLQTESVTYIVQRFTSLGVFFYLLTILTHLLAGAASNWKTAWLWRAGSVVALVLGMLSKEEVFTAPFLLIALDWLVMGAPLKVALKRAWPHLLCLPIIPLLIVLTSHAQHGGNLTLAGAVNIVNPHAYSSYHYALTQLSVVLLYLRLIMFPAGLNLDWEYPLSTSLLEGRVLISAALIIVLIAGSWLWWRIRRTDVRCALIFVSVIWYFTTLAISSSVLPLPDLICEHRCYLASIGAVCALVCCVDLLRSRLAHVRVVRFIVPAATVVWVLALSAATVARNNVWRSELTIWSDTTAKSPHKGRAWSNLGVAYHEHGKPQEAISCFRKVIQLDPRYLVGYQNLGVALNSVRQYQEAFVVSQLGLRYEPNCAPLHFNMGVSCYGLGQTSNSIQSLTQAITICPRHVLAHVWLAGIHSDLRQYDTALKHYRIAASLSPSNSTIQQMLKRTELLIRPPTPVLTLNLR